MIDDKYWSVLFNASPQPTLLLRADHPAYSVAYANEACAAFTNLKQQEIVGNSLANLLRTQSVNVNKILHMFHHVMQYKTAQKLRSVKFDFRTPQTDTFVIKYADIIGTPILGEDGGVELISCVFNDVTELIVAQRNERATREDLVKYEKFLSESQRIAHIGNWEVDMMNNIITWSDVLKEIYEVPADYQPTFESGLAFYKDDYHRSIIINAVREAAERNSVFDVELEIVTAAGNLRWIRSTGKADVKDDKCVRLYGVTQDITSSKIAEKALIESSRQYQALVESVEGVVWEADASTFKFTYISNKINSILGYTPDQWLNEPNFWANHIYRDDREWAVNYCQSQTKEILNHVFDYRMIKADGGIVWIKDLVSVIAENGKPKILRGVMIDITESKLLASLDHLEKSVLELAANKQENLQQILVMYLKGIEDLLPHMKCSLLEVKNNKVYTLAAPTLPTDFINAINGQKIGPDAGSCGRAAYRKEKVIVADIANDPLWEKYKEPALKSNIRASWSCPIINSDGDVMAVFAMYYDEVKEPGDTEQLIIERSAAILKVILENRQRARIIEENTLLMMQGQELANFGSWQWDIKNNTVEWSDVLYNIYGVNKNNHIATYERYLSMLHPDDREMVSNIIFNAVQTREDIVFEERIIRPNGEIRNLKSWGRVICDANGNPEKMIGSCLDITTTKIAESQLWDIAWMQSHLVRAPLARLMGLVGLLKEEHKTGNEIEAELLDYIMTTAQELDKVVTDISNKTVQKV